MRDNDGDAFPFSTFLFFCFATYVQALIIKQMLHDLTKLYQVVKSAWRGWGGRISRDLSLTESLQRGAERFARNTNSRASSVSAMLHSLNWVRLKVCIPWSQRFCLSREGAKTSGEAARREKPLVILDLNLTFMHTLAATRVKLIINKGSNGNLAITRPPGITNPANEPIIDLRVCKISTNPSLRVRSWPWRVHEVRFKSKVTRGFSLLAASRLKKLD